MFAVGATRRWRVTVSGDLQFYNDRGDGTFCELPILARLDSSRQPTEVTAVAPQMKKGRKFPGLDYRKLDKPLLIEMRTKIQSGVARSPTDAARALVDKAAGKSTPASKVERLAKGYRETYPDKT